jgi:DNA-binding IclR family transcriptional regulator
VSGHVKQRAVMQSPGPPFVTSKKTTAAPPGTQLLDRAVAILKFLGDAGEIGARSAEITEHVRLSGPTSHRIIAALERHGLIEREQATKRHRLGLSLFALGARAADGTGLRKICRPALLRLASESGDTVFLMARSGFNAVCVDRQEGTYIIDSLTGHVGGQIPLGVGPASEAILAFLPPDEARVILAANEARYAGYNGLTADKIAAALPDIRQNGYAIDDGRLVAGISAIAVPIKPQGRDVIAALTINMTSARLSPQRVGELLDALRREVHEIEQQVNPMHAVAQSRRANRRDVMPSLPD